MRNKIEKLLSSNLTNYQIAKDTKMSHKTISELRAGKRKIGNLTLDTAEKLYNYQKGLDRIEELKTKVIEIKNSNNVESIEEIDQFFIEIKNHGNNQFDVEYALLNKVEDDYGNKYYELERYITKEVTFADEITETNLSKFKNKWLKVDKSGETYIERFSFKTEEEAIDFAKLVLNASDSFENCAKKIGIIE